VQVRGQPSGADPLPAWRDGTARRALLELVMATHAGMTTDEFAATVTGWLLEEQLRRGSGH